MMLTLIGQKLKELGIMKNIKENNAFKVLHFFVTLVLFIYLFIYWSFLRPHSQHMEVPRLGVKSEL